MPLAGLGRSFTKERRIPSEEGYDFSFGLKKLVSLFMLVVLTFLSASTPRLLVLFRLVPAAAFSVLPGRLVGGIDAARVAADKFARWVS